MVYPVFPPRCKRPEILPEHGCFQDQRDAMSPGKANTTVLMKRFSMTDTNHRLLEIYAIYL